MNGRKLSKDQGRQSHSAWSDGIIRITNGTSVANQRESCRQNDDIRGRFFGGDLAAEIV